MQPGSPLARIPEPVLAGLMALVSRTKVNRVFKELMPSGVGELKAVFDEDDHVRDFSVLPPNTSFMVGGKSPGYYKVTAERLHRAVPGSDASRSRPRASTAPSPRPSRSWWTDISAYFKG